MPTSTHSLLESSRRRTHKCTVEGTLETLTPERQDCGTDTHRQWVQERGHRKNGGLEMNPACCCGTPLCPVSGCLFVSEHGGAGQSRSCRSCTSTSHRVFCGTHPLPPKMLYHHRSPRANNFGKQYILKPHKRFTMISYRYGVFLRINVSYCLSLSQTFYSLNGFRPGQLLAFFKEKTPWIPCGTHRPNSCS